MAEKFFLGGMTPKGFQTQLGEYVSGKEYYTYILKGGAGTGKSSLMKGIADSFERGENVTRYYCSSDPDSLDAVVLHSSKAVVVDGTAPHVFDPKYPGVCQKIVNLGYYWNDRLLKGSREQILAACDENKALMSRAASYNAALGKVCGDIFAAGESCIDGGKLEGFCQRFCKKLFGKRKGHRGKSSIRQLSAMTRYGYMTFTETLENYLDIYCLRDDLFSASHRLMGYVAAQAQQRGYDVKLSPCLLFEDRVWEHLLIDEIGVALVSSSLLTELELRGAARVNMGRFYTKQGLSACKGQIKTDRELIRRLAELSRGAMDAAKQVHDLIESYYIGAMDFDAVGRVGNNISEEIKLMQA